MLRHDDGFGRLASAVLTDQTEVRFSSGLAHRYRPRRGAKWTAAAVAARLVRLSAMQDEAGQVLRHLKEARDRSEAHLAELGKSDAVKAVTGTSAMERAIAETQTMVEEIEGLVRKLRLESGETGGEVVRPSVPCPS